jgi:uncharacterized protein YllA (UPF0747 family)
LAESRREIMRLQNEMEEQQRQQEENLMKQMQEFKQLDELRKRKITRYKEEADHQIDQYKQMVDILKAKGAKQETNTREAEYQSTIQTLQKQL